MSYCIKFGPVHLYQFKYCGSIVHMWGPSIPDFYGVSQRLGSLALFSIPEQAQRLIDSCPHFYRGAEIIEYVSTTGETDNGANNSMVNV